MVSERIRTMIVQPLMIRYQMIQQRTQSIKITIDKEINSIAMIKNIARMVNGDMIGIMGETIRLQEVIQFRIDYTV